MGFKIREINNKKVWEEFLSRTNEKTFLQSWNWGEFQKVTGNKIWRLGVYTEDNLLGLTLVIKITARRGVFLFCPHGPVIKEQKTENRKQILREFINVLKEIAGEEGASFIRIAPIWERNRENIKIFKTLGFREAPIHMHPELTWMLDITPDEEQLLMQMRKTTRYLIRQAQKNPDVIISNSQKLDNVEKFNELYQITVDRHNFIPFSLDYLKNEVSAFLSDNQVVIFLGRYKEEILGSAIVIYWQGTAFYHQGASSLKYPKIPVSYLLQWEAIKEAKKRGCKIYNFWGIASTDSSRHPWAGLTLFKKGFGGYEKEYVKTQDLPLSKKYWLNYFVEKLRKTRRGL
ncbi:MAG TPA: peptidoglycan bridge formation glycyltransferase FemA/FemB family protein [Candidatus Nealsonbacteria bacterium]|uniref:BioF2-like acetyltransferase domain-containing protein n=1 Tax=marine sediment metagenome TaxID=412755 RepID=A0A0F9VSB7_9ZZZZ|nr:peptidoglycan bridge formation glycyltransferase FemA/FemB family protein [Candidatus Nealsonbacteria bacterium]HEB46490.1 peptidoglycan bridge formation glycyltransferase FemA/FemB family protein [Candidatus Nealsonbacteria bacterium]